jgi:hypothetical protein
MAVPPLTLAKVLQGAMCLLMLWLKHEDIAGCCRSSLLEQ